MSVIAKLSIRSITAFHTGQLVELGCVCANDLMTAYAESDEDKLFTKYSPWGEMKLCQPAGYALGNAGDEFVQGTVLYAVILRPDEVDGQTFDGAYGVCPIKVANITDFGDGQAKKIEFQSSGDNALFRGVDRLNWKMSVDNPGATDQLLAGKGGYMLALYPEARYDRNAAIRAAHG